MPIEKIPLSTLKGQPNGLASLDPQSRVPFSPALTTSARYVSPRDFGGNPGNAGDNTAAVQAAIDYCQQSRGSVLYIDGYYRLAGSLLVSGSITVVGQNSSGNNSGTDKSVLAWEGAPAGTEHGLRIIGQNWAFSNVALKGGLRVRRVLQLEACSVGRLRDCQINGAIRNDPTTPGTAVWGYGLINVLIDGCFIQHSDYSRGIDVRESNKPEGSAIYYGFDNGSKITSCRIYGDMANAIIDGGTFEVSNCDFEGKSTIDTGKIIIHGTSTKLKFSGNYCEFDNTYNTAPEKTPIVWVQNQGSGHFFEVVGNTGYMVPTKESGSIGFDLGSGAPNSYYDNASIVCNNINRFESALSLRGRTGAGYTLMRGNVVSSVARTFASKSYYSASQSRSSGALFPGDYGPTVSSGSDSHAVMDDALRTEGQTRADMWVEQSSVVIDLTIGNKISYVGLAGGELTYGGRVSGFTVTNGGSGYASASVVIQPNGVGGKNVTGVVALTMGSLGGVSIACEGENYTAAPSVTVTGDGSGATVTAATDLSVQPCFCGAEYRIHNGAAGAVTLKTGNGLAGTFRAGVGVGTPVFLAPGQLAVVSILPSRVAVVEAVVG